MRYRVDYVQHAARLVRKIEARMRLGEDAMSREELMDVLKTAAQAMDEIAAAIEGLQRRGE